VKRARRLANDNPLPIAGGALILWIAASPWIWGYAGSHSAVANHVAIVFGFGPLALMMANLRAAALVTLLGGAWLAVSPWLLGYASDHAAWLCELVTGFLLVVLSVRAAGLRRAAWPRAKAGLDGAETMQHSIMSHSN
jgi:SPW repeat